MYKPTTKNLILLGIPVILSVLSLFINIVAKVGKIIIIVSIIIILSFYIFSIIIYGKKEKNDKKMLQEIIDSDNSNKAKLASVGKILNTRVNIINYTAGTMETWSKRINQIAYDISKGNTPNQSDWKLEEIYEGICCGCKSMIQTFIETKIIDNNIEINDNDNISVGFIKYYIRNGTKYVKMIAHSSLQNARPDIFGKEETLDECIYQYARLINKKTNEIIAYENNEKIRENFSKKNENTDLSKYSQYIALPIVCSNNRILGVLQITAKHNYIIMDSEDELKLFSRTFVTPFTELIMLAEKIQKGLFAKIEGENL